MMIQDTEENIKSDSPPISLLEANRALQLRKLVHYVIIHVLYCVIIHVLYCVIIHVLYCIIIHILNVL